MIHGVWYLNSNHMVWYCGGFPPAAEQHVQSSSIGVIFIGSQWSGREMSDVPGNIWLLGDAYNIQSAIDIKRFPK